MSAIVAEAAARAPGTPGCYFMLGDDNELLYVGKAGNLRRRLRDHSRAPLEEGEVRLRQMYELVRDVRWVELATEHDALRVEADLIVALEPRFNAALIDGGRWLYVTIAAPQDDAALRFEVDNVARGGSGRRVYGCFAHIGAGLVARPGIASGDGLTAFFRVLWAAGNQVTSRRVPAAIRATTAPRSVSIAVDPLLRPAVHAFLSGQSARLLTALEEAARRDEVPAFMRPALTRDLAKARHFFECGPSLLRALRLRHKLPAKPVSREVLIAAWTSELREVIGDFRVNPRSPSPAPGFRRTRSGWIP